MILYSQCLIQTLSKTTAKSDTEEVYFCLGRSHCIAGHILSTAAHARVYYRVEAECKLTGSLAPCSIRHQYIGSPHAAPYMSIATNSGVPLLHMLPLPQRRNQRF
jgi:hypothetical protein